MTKTTHLGGTMYGDGEYVVEFSGVDSREAPLSAHVLGPKCAIAGPFYAAKRPSVALAASIIATVRRMDA